MTFSCYHFKKSNPFLHQSSKGRKLMVSNIQLWKSKWKRMVKTIHWRTWLNAWVFYAKSVAKVLINPRSFKGVNKAYVVTFTVRWSSCWHCAHSWVWIVVVQWHCGVMPSYVHRWSEAPQLRGLNELYKQMSYQLAWLYWHRENDIVTTSLIPHTFTYNSLKESISTPKDFSWHNL